MFTVCQTQPFLSNDQVSANLGYEEARTGRLLAIITRTAVAGCSCHLSPSKSFLISQRLQTYITSNSIKSVTDELGIQSSPTSNSKYHHRPRIAALATSIQYPRQPYHLISLYDINVV